MSICHSSAIGIWNRFRFSWGLDLVTGLGTLNSAAQDNATGLALRCAHLTNFVYSFCFMFVIFSIAFVLDPSRGKDLP